MLLPIPKHFEIAITRRPGMFMWLAVCLFAATLASVTSSDRETSCTLSEDTQSGRASSLLQLRHENTGFAAGEKTTGAVLGKLDGLEGLLAPLNQEGFARVAATRSPEQMDQFVRRTLASMSLHVTRASDLGQAIPELWHDGGEAGIPHSFEDLQYELVKIGERARGAVNAHPGLAELTLAELTASQSAAQATTSERVEQEGSSFAAHGLASFGQSSSSSSFVANYGSKIQGTLANQETGLGTNADLNEAGYTSVLQLKNNREMEVFLRRTIYDLGLTIVSEQGLKSMVPWLSGEAGSSTFGSLKGKILNTLSDTNAWVADTNQLPQAPISDEEPATGYHANGGSDAPISEEGYMSTANLNSNVEMVSFIDRVVDDMGLHVTNHGGVEGLAPFFSGDKQVGNLKSLESEIFKAAETPGSWVSPWPGNM